MKQSETIPEYAHPATHANEVKATEAARIEAQANVTATANRVPAQCPPTVADRG